MISLHKIFQAEKGGDELGIGSGFPAEAAVSVCSSGATWWKDGVVPVLDSPSPPAWPRILPNQPFLRLGGHRLCSRNTFNIAPSLGGFLQEGGGGQLSQYELKICFKGIRALPLQATKHTLTGTQTGRHRHTDDRHVTLTHVDTHMQESHTQGHTQIHTNMHTQKHKHTHAGTPHTHQNVQKDKHVPSSTPSSLCSPAQAPGGSLLTAHWLL